MGWERRNFGIGPTAYTPPSPVKITKGSTWEEEWYVSIPTTGGGFTSAQAVDSAKMHIRNRIEDTEKYEYGTTPLDYITVTRPTPETLKVAISVPHTVTATINLSAPDDANSSGLLAVPVDPVPGEGVMALEITLTNGKVFEIFRSKVITIPEIVR